MKIEKLNNNSYRMRKTYKGKTYTVITDYKPTQKEAIQLMAAELEKEQTEKTRRTFGRAIDDYMEIKSNVLSPSTLRSYKGMANNISDKLKNMRLSQICADDVQIEINRLAASKSPKTVINYHGLISAVLGMYRPDLRLNTTLPQREKVEYYIPTSDEVKRVFDEARGTRYEAAFILGAFGFRRSEIIAVMPEDIDGNKISINKAKVMGTDGKYVNKANKTTDSKRVVPVSAHVCDLIKEQGYAFKGDPDCIVEELHRIQDRLNIPRFRLHDLRHFFVTELSQAGFSDEDICALGGWSDSAYVMKRIYRHSRIQNNDDSQSAAVKLIEDLIS